MSSEEEKRKLKEFEEREKERFDNELQRLNIRHMKQLEEYRIKADNIMKDLDDEQRLKRKQLVDAETKCLRDVDERYNQEYTYWQNKLRSRKQKLEDDFKREEIERSQFYQTITSSAHNSANGNGSQTPVSYYGTHSNTLNPSYYSSNNSTSSSIISNNSVNHSNAAGVHISTNAQLYYALNNQNGTFTKTSPQHANFILNNNQQQSASNEHQFYSTPPFVHQHHQQHLNQQYSSAPSVSHAYHQSTLQRKGNEF